MFWQTIITALTNWLTGTFGQEFADFFKKIFGEAAKDKPDPIIKVGAAPDEIKDVIRKMIVELVESALANRPFIRGIVLAIVRNLPDTFIDQLWDSIFAAKIAAGELPASATFAKPAPMKAEPPKLLSSVELAAAKQEAGIK